MVKSIYIKMVTICTVFLEENALETEVDCYIELMHYGWDILFRLGYIILRPKL